MNELLKADASIKETNGDGEISLMWTILYSCSEIERMLRDLGATLNKSEMAFNDAPRSGAADSPSYDPIGKYNTHLKGRGNSILGHSGASCLEQ